ncbi:hypothetical protein Poli38472_013731 [Pythium oligandrum]|uniref:FAD-binding FR-type domain-containing protein n=1 Tax=Pythium oligandrum TaxID=41045 RepID=A0A8K1CEV5_PYTOL|nr:hypothetical protein Poli38472_013731 [Pythium oligandrum]|eukprot:TMW61268.1 hypothetical protein Poli38472_013731 [Pythium oligandrum]
MFVVKSKNADTSAINKPYMELERDTSGWATFQCMLALTVLSFYKIRRRWFGLFLRFHWVLFLAIIALAVIHGAAMVLVGVVPWALDVIFRYGIQVPLDQRRALHVGQVSVTTIATDLVRIQFPRVRTTIDNTGAKTTRAFHYEAGQYVFICIPRLSVLEWHPFTIGSALPNDMVIVYIKVLGDWTKKLAELASSQPTDNQIAVLIEGPYGAVSIDFEHSTTYSHFVLVSGGIGMTPMMALANQLFFDATHATPRHDAVWSVRERELIEALFLNATKPRGNEIPELAGPLPAQTWLPDVLCSTDSSNSNSGTFLCDIYLTKGTQLPDHPVDQTLGHCIKYGQRPDLAETLRQIGELTKQANPTNARVGVMVCGPSAMIRDVVTQSLLQSKTLGVCFDVHQETFDFQVELLLSWTAYAASTASALRLNGWYSCSTTEDAALLVANPQFECAKAELPLCHNEICVSNKTVEVFVKRKLAQQEDPNGKNRTVWFLQGGPGASSANMEQDMLLMYALTNATIDVYTMDHRGTGRSGFLQCDAAQALANGSPGGEALLLDELPSCVDDVLYEMDYHPEAYSVTSAAKDVEALVDFFHTQKDEAVYVYGVSYGTYLVGRVMHLAPPHIKGYMLDGVLPETGFSTADWNAYILEPTRRLLEACFDAPKCPLKLESRETVVEEVLQMYESIDVSVEDNVCAQLVSGSSGDDATPPSYMLRMLLGVLVRDTEWRTLVFSLLQRVYRCSQLDFEELELVWEPIVNQILMNYGMTPSQRSAPPPRVQSSGASTTPFLSELLYDLITFSELMASPVPTLDNITEAFYAGPFSEDGFDLGTYCAMIGAFRPDFNGSEPACDEIQDWVQYHDAVLPEMHHTFVYAHDKYWNTTATIPENASVLLVVGGLDFQTPSELGKREYEELKGKNKLLVEFAYGGHGTGFAPTELYDETHCGARILTSYVLNDGDVTRVDTSCIEKLPAFIPDDSTFDEVVLEVLEAQGLAK